VHCLPRACRCATCDGRIARRLLRRSRHLWRARPATQRHQPRGCVAGRDVCDRRCLGHHHRHDSLQRGKPSWSVDARTRLQPSATNSCSHVLSTHLLVTCIGDTIVRMARQREPDPCCFACLPACLPVVCGVAEHWRHADHTCGLSSSHPARRVLRDHHGTDR